MNSLTENLNLVTSLGAVIGQVALVLLFMSWLFAYVSGDDTWSLTQKIVREYSNWIMPVSFVIVAIAVLASLLYSEVIGFVPCELCWWQRVLMYPQLIILGLAVWKKTKDAAIYCLTLSSIGAVVAGYHFYGQSFNPNALPACDIIAGATSCAVKYFAEFGFVTLPLMAFTTFVLIMIGMLLHMSSEKMTQV